jgi:hypothetical protein
VPAARRGEERQRQLRAWDFVHSPPWTEHIFVGAGDRPCAILVAGARGEGWQVRYPVSEFAARHGASAAKEVSSPAEAYIGRLQPSRRGWPSDWDRLPWA